MKITKAVATLGLAAIALTSLTGCQNLVQNAPVTCKVTDKDRSTESTKNGSKSVFRVYTEGEGCDGTYGLADNFLAGNFNASDMFGRIKVGSTYRIESVGVRNGFFSSFKEITKVTEVAK
jgi:hypothetical protein